MLKTLLSRADLEQSDKSPSNLTHQRSVQQPIDVTSSGNSCFSPLLSANAKTSNKSRTILKTASLQYQDQNFGTAEAAIWHPKPNLDEPTIIRTGEEDVGNSTPSPYPIYKGTQVSPIKGVKSLQI